MNHNLKITIFFACIVLKSQAMGLGEQLYNAATTGEIGKTHMLLTQGVDVNFAVGNGETPIIPASKHNHVVVVRTLIEFGANVDAADQFGWTALMLASRNGHMKVVQCLLQAQANPNMVNELGGFALAEAAKNGRHHVTEELLEWSADVDQIDGHGKTPLMLASQYGYINVARVLLQAGADLHYISHGKTPLMLASHCGYINVARVLLQAGADLHYISQCGDSALTEAAHITLLRTRFPTHKEGIEKKQEYAVRVQHEKYKKEQLVQEFIERGAPILSKQHMKQRGVPHSMIEFIMQNKDTWRHTYSRWKEQRTLALHKKLARQGLPKEITRLIITMDIDSDKIQSI